MTNLLLVCLLSCLGFASAFVPHTAAKQSHHRSLAFVSQKAVQQSHYRSSALRAVNLADPLKQQCTWRLVHRSSPVATVEDVVGVICRFDEREEFMQGEGYHRPPDGNLLTAERMFERLQNLDFCGKRWPIDKEGELVGLGGRGLSDTEIKSEIERVSSLPASEAGSLAVFTSLAKGAANGCAFPQQIDEELAKFLYMHKGDNADFGGEEMRKEKGRAVRVLDTKELENVLLQGKVGVAFGWMTYVVLQAGAVYTLFLGPFLRLNFPDIYAVLYPLDTMQ